MLKIETDHNYKIGLKNTYRIKFENETSDYEALHNYILCIIFGIDLTENKREEVNELSKYLRLSIEKGSPEPYEVQFFYELNRALGQNAVNDSLLSTYPEYKEYCKLKIDSCDFLEQIELFDAAIICCNELYYSCLINNVEYFTRMSTILCSKGDLEGAFHYLVGIMEEYNFYVAPHIIAKATKLAITLNKQEEMLDIFRKGVQEHPYVKWVSKDYMSLCLDCNLIDEAKEEFNRLEGIVKHIYQDTEITRQSMGLFKYFCGTRKLLGLDHDVEAVATEYGFRLSMEPSPRKKEKASDGSQSNPWENKANNNLNKALLKRVNKMNKPLRTFFKAFRGGENELVFSKSILGNYLSVIKNRFRELFGNDEFQVTDYDVFNEAFPFYSLNSFEDEEIDEAVVLLSRICEICMQVNPYVSSRMYPIGSMLADILSVNTEIELSNKTLSFSVTDNDETQITLFGACLFICTFLNSFEKEAFSYELAGADVKLTSALETQIFNTIPSSKHIFSSASDSIESDRETAIFSLYIRRELFRFILSIESLIITENELLDTQKPNANSQSFYKVLERKFSRDSIQFDCISEIRKIALSGVQLGVNFNGKIFTVGNIVSLLTLCRQNENYYDIFQPAIESIFTICVNRKYYNYLKWKTDNQDASFLSNTDKYSKKMMLRNTYLLTESDENIIYDASVEHIFSPIDDTQSEEFRKLFRKRAMSWDKLQIEINRIDKNDYVGTINGKEINGEYFLLRENDELIIQGRFRDLEQHWTERVIFDSAISRFILKELKK